MPISKQKLTTELLTVNFHCFGFSCIKISVVGEVVTHE